MTPSSFNTHTTSNMEGTALLFLKEVWKHHGTPQVVVSDRGPQFVAGFTHELYKLLGIKSVLHGYGYTCGFRMGTAMGRGMGTRILTCQIPVPVAVPVIKKLDSIIHSSNT
jgi:hypothetical protein